MCPPSFIHIRLHVDLFRKDSDRLGALQRPAEELDVKAECKRTSRTESKIVSKRYYCWWHQSIKLELGVKTDKKIWLLNNRFS